MKKLKPKPSAAFGLIPARIPPRHRGSRNCVGFVEFRFCPSSWRQSCPWDRARLSLGSIPALPFPGPCREDQEGLRSLRNGASQTQVTVAPCGLQRFWGHPALLRARGHSLIPPLFPLSPHSLQLCTLPANSSSPGSSSNTPSENKNLKEIHLSLRMLTHFGVRSTGFKEQRHFWEEEEEPSWGSPRRGWFWLWCLREVPVT